MSDLPYLTALLRDAIEALDTRPRDDTNWSEAEGLARVVLNDGWRRPSPRCPNCDHLVSRHTDRGACCFVIEEPVVCPCSGGPEKGDVDD